MGIERGSTFRKSRVRNPIKIYVIATEVVNERVYFEYIGEINENADIIIVPTGNLNETDYVNNIDQQNEL